MDWTQDKYRKGLCSYFFSVKLQDKILEYHGADFGTGISTVFDSRSQGY